MTTLPLHFLPSPVDMSARELAIRAQACRTLTLHLALEGPDEVRCALQAVLGSSPQACRHARSCARDALAQRRRHSLALRESEGLACGPTAGVGRLLEEPEQRDLALPPARAARARLRNPGSSGGHHRHHSSLLLHGRTQRNHTAHVTSMKEAAVRLPSWHSE